MTSEIDKLKHFHVEDYSGTNFMLLYLLLMVIVVVLHYRSAYNVSKRRK